MSTSSNWMTREYWCRTSRGIWRLKVNFWGIHGS
jgi:hypothetical protein